MVQAELKLRVGIVGPETRTMNDDQDGRIVRAMLQRVIDSLSANEELHFTMHEHGVRWTMVARNLDIERAHRRPGVVEERVTGFELACISTGEPEQCDPPVSDMDAGMDLNDYSTLCHLASKANGWWSNPDGSPKQRNKGEMFMLMVSEIAEAMEGDRKNLQDDKLPHRSMVEVELADALIRIFDLAGGFGLDLEGALREKLEYNKQRQDHRPNDPTRPSY